MKYLPFFLLFFSFALYRCVCKKEDTPTPNPPRPAIVPLSDRAIDFLGSVKWLTPNDARSMFFTNGFNETAVGVNDTRVGYFYNEYSGNFKVATDSTISLTVRKYYSPSNDYYAVLVFANNQVMSTWKAKVEASYETWTPVTYDTRAFMQDCFSFNTKYSCMLTFNTSGQSLWVTAAL